MRDDSVQVINARQSAVTSPRFIVRIQFEVNPPIFTSHDGVTNLPGQVADQYENTLKNISGTTAKIIPEQGRAEIGAISIQVVDVDGDFTEELRTKLLAGRGVNRIPVEVYVAYQENSTTVDWNNAQLVATQQVEAIQYQGGVYQISCKDVQRLLRTDVFEPKQCRLTESITDDGTLIPSDFIYVDDTSDFQMLKHTTSFLQSGDGGTYGYARIKKTKEIFRYSGTSDTGISPQTATAFTGIERGAFNTTPQVLEIDPAWSNDELPIVEEVVYLEMPGPQLAYALLTGVVLDSGSPPTTLPTHWHGGVDTSLVRVSDFENIGTDLYDSSNFRDGMIFRFIDPDKTDLKKFVEGQLNVAMGTFSPIYSDGAIGFKRLSKLVAQCPHADQITSADVFAVGPLIHDQKGLFNQLEVDWNYSFLDSEYTRRQLYIDATSVSIHRIARSKSWKFRGLANNTSTSQTIAQFFETYRDRFAEPPIRLQLTVSGRFNHLEPGDVVNVQLPSVRDYADDATLDRSFEVQQSRINWRTGQVRLNLFGSSRPIAGDPITPATGNVLLDSFYSSEGTAINALSPDPMTGDTITSNVTLTGTTDMNAAGSVYYHLGDLTIDTGVTVTIENNVQLRVMGALTVNGTLTGAGNGIVGVADPHSEGSSPTVGYDVQDPPITGTPGFLGSTRSQEGVQNVQIYNTGEIVKIPFAVASTIPIHATFPKLQIRVVGAGDSPAASQIKGIPGDLRGSSGGPGGILLDRLTDQVRRGGGDGGDGGAGLCIIARGMASPGASGSVVMDGADGAVNGSNYVWGGHAYYSGGGAGGAPGAMLVLIDGNDATYPTFATGEFSAASGATTIQGEAAVFANPAVAGSLYLDWSTAPRSGRDTVIGNIQHGAAHYNIQYLPTDETVSDQVDAVDDSLRAPYGLSVVVLNAGNFLQWQNLEPTAVVEIWRSNTDNLGDASLHAETFGYNYLDTDFIPGASPPLEHYYWIRAREGRSGAVSDFHPDTQTTTVSDTGVSAPTSMTVTGHPEGVLVSWTNPIPGRYSRIEVWASGTNNRDNAVLIGDSPAGYFVHRLTVNVRQYYWVRSVNSLGRASIWEPQTVTSAQTILPFPTATRGPGTDQLFEDAMQYVNQAAFEQEWQPVSVDPNAVVTFPDTATSEFGGKVLRIQGGAAYSHGRLMPFDEVNGLYRVAMRVRMIQADTSSPIGGRYLYVGLAGVGGDGETLINTDGNPFYGGQHFITAYAVKEEDMTADDWVVMEGYVAYVSTVKAEHLATINTYSTKTFLGPATMQVFVKYLRPIFYVNFPATGNHDGIMEIDWFKVEKFVHRATGQYMMDPNFSMEMGRAWEYKGNNWAPTDPGAYAGLIEDGGEAGTGAMILVCTSGLASGFRYISNVHEFEVLPREKYDLAARVKFNHPEAQAYMGYTIHNEEGTVVDGSGATDNATSPVDTWTDINGVMTVPDFSTESPIPLKKRGRMYARIRIGITHAEGAESPDRAFSITFDNIRVGKRDTVDVT